MEEHENIPACGPGLLNSGAKDILRGFRFADPAVSKSGNRGKRSINEGRIRRLSPSPFLGCSLPRTCRLVQSDQYRRSEFNIMQHDQLTRISSKYIHGVERAFMDWEVKTSDSPRCVSHLRVSTIESCDASSSNRLHLFVY